MKTLTAAQEEIYLKVQELLDEHFDAWVLSIETDLDDLDESGKACTFWCGAYGGGKNRAKGLALSHLDRLREIRKDALEED